MRVLDLRRTGLVSTFQTVYSARLQSKCFCFFKGQIEQTFVIVMISVDIILVCFYVTQVSTRFDVVRKMADVIQATEEETIITNMVVSSINQT